MSPTLSGLQRLINECILFYNSNGISLNIEKTEFLASGQRTPSDTCIEMNFHQIAPGDKLKHLGFIWSKKRKYGTLADVNISERLSKFWSVVHCLIKGGIRFCQPESIIELYKTLAVPTLTYGLEIPQLTHTQLNFLDTQGRKAIKFLFNISQYSKNHLNNIFNIDDISNIIVNNKLKLVARLMNNESTRKFMLSTLQSDSVHQSTVRDCFQLAGKHGINFFDILLNNFTTKVATPHNTDVPEEILECLEFWNIGGKRKRF